MIRLKHLVLICAALAMVSITSNLHAAAAVRLSVAASMTEVFKELTSDFMQAHPDIRIITNFGSSGALAKQIYQGAPADIYVSANPKWMDYLAQHTKITPESRTTLAHTSLVFIGRPNREITTTAGLKTLKRIGIGSPGSVPAGQYARQALQSNGLYRELLSKGKLVMAKDVRQALIYADRGETDGSFVYATDSRLARNAVILFMVPQGLYDPVSYPLALTPEGAEKPEARILYNFLGSTEAKKILLEYGFSLPATGNKN